MPKPDLTDEEQAAVIAALRKLIAETSAKMSEANRGLSVG
jgi:hypothetical protein